MDYHFADEPCPVLKENIQKHIIGTGKKKK